MNRALVLDTSAILAYFEDEDGADQVGDLLLQASRGTVRLLVCFVSLTELRYILLQEKGQSSADQALAILASWPVEVVHSDHALCRQAAAFKAVHRVSLADSFIAAAARLGAATLVHKDPEFESLAREIALLPLPYK